METIYRKPRRASRRRKRRSAPTCCGLVIERPNQVWAADLTYVPMAHGFQYLVAILDVCSRKVLSWRVSNTMTPDFCVEALEEALARHGKPEVFNTDQGSQSRERTGERARRRGSRSDGRQGGMDRQRVH